MIYLVPVERDIAIEDHMVSYIFTTIYYTLPYLPFVLAHTVAGEPTGLTAVINGGVTSSHSNHPLIKKLTNTLMRLPSKQTVIMCRYNDN